MVHAEMLQALGTDLNMQTAGQLEATSDSQLKDDFGSSSELQEHILFEEESPKIAEVLKATSAANCSKSTSM